MSLVEGVSVHFHIGLHKTGTTSYQHVLSSRREEFIKQGVLYPESLSGAQFPNQHADIVTLLYQRKYGMVYEYFNSVVQGARSLRCRSIIFSAEDFCGLGQDSSLLKDFKEIVDSIFLESKFVLVARSLCEWTPSWLAQLLEGGNVAIRHGALDSLIEDVIQSRLDIVANWIELFRDRLLLLSYENLSKDDNLCMNLHRYIDKDSVNLVFDVRHNSTYSKSESDLLFGTVRSLISAEMGLDVYSAAVKGRVGEFFNLAAFEDLANSGRYRSFRAYFMEFFRKSVSEVLRIKASQFRSRNAVWGDDDIWKLFMGLCD